jgi:O-antigen ligase
LRQVLKNRLIHELNWLVLLFPLWWFLGVEQFFWFLSVTVIFIQFVIYSKFEFHVNFLALLLFTFLIVYGISIISITEQMRYITYFRNISTYITALMILVICWNIIDEWVQIERLLSSVVFVMLIASVIGLLAFAFESFRIEFRSPIGFLLPSSIANTGYGSVIAVRNVGYYNQFIGLDYFRISSFFLYSTMFSSTLAIVLPIAIFIRKISIGLKRKYYTLVVFILILALIATTGRVAILAIVMSFIIYKLLSVRSISIKLSLVFICVTMLCLFIFWLEQSGVLYQIIDMALYSRGEGSANTRYKIYVKTFESFLERPFFGWGTERDVKGLAYPLGSHSYYLGTLYKQGIIGFLIFISIILSIWSNIRTKNIFVEKFNLFFKYGQFMMLVFMINSFTDVLDLDATTMMFLWLIISLLVVSRRIIIQKTKNNA